MLICLQIAFALSFQFSQNPGIIEVNIEGEIQFIITDPAGKRSGFDPVKQQRFDEINRSYGVMSVDSEDPEIEAPPSVKQFMTYTPLEGDYRLVVKGLLSTRVTSNILMARSTRGDSKVFEFEAVLDSGQSVEYLLQFDQVRNAPFRVSRVLSDHSLRQDLDNCYKLQLLGAKQLYIDLSHRVDKYEEWIQKADTAKARQELEKLGKKLDEVYVKSKGPSKDPNHFIKEDAYRILKEDVGGLVEYLSR